jgi:hypothetical protein
MRREMGQFVETDQCDLSALPVVDGRFKLQVRKLDLAGARPAPLAHAEVRGPTDPRIEVLALIRSCDRTSSKNFRDCENLGCDLEIGLEMQLTAMLTIAAIVAPTLQLCPPFRTFEISRDGCDLVVHDQLCDGWWRALSSERPATTSSDFYRTQPPRVAG